jgi:hypothetical protein
MTGHQNEAHCECGASRRVYRDAYERQRAAAYGSARLSSI